MKKFVLGICTIFFLSVLALGSSGAEKEHSIQWGLSGGSGFGYSHRSENWLIGGAIGGSFTKQSTDTNRTYIGGWIARRKLIASNVHLNYGIEAYKNMGKVSGVDIDSSYEYGPWVGVNIYLTDFIFISSWINPVYFSSEELDNGSNTTSTTFFKGGGGLGFLF